MNADALPEFARQTGPEFFAVAIRSACGSGRLPSPPRSGGARRLPFSTRCGRPVPRGTRGGAGVADVPVIQVPLPIELPVPTLLPRAALGLPEGFVFLFSFDFRSVFERKNPLALGRGLQAARSTPDRAPR